MRELKLKLKNFAAFADCEFPLDRYQGATLIVGKYVNGDPGVSNGAGKSTFIEAIVWSIFGVCRAKTDDEMIRGQESEMSVTNIFEIDGAKYEIIRTKKRGKSQTLLFSDLTHDKKLRGNSVKETQAKIIDVIGMDFNTFSQTVYSPQKKLDLFPASLPSARKEVLSSILGIDHYADVEERARRLASDHELDAGALGMAIDRLQAEIAQEGASPERIAVLEAEVKTLEEDLVRARAVKSAGLEEAKKLNSKAAFFQKLSGDLRQAQESLDVLATRSLGADTDWNQQIGGIHAEQGILEETISNEVLVRGLIADAESKIASGEKSEERLTLLRTEQFGIKVNADSLRQELAAMNRDMVQAKQSLERLVSQAEYAKRERVQQLAEADNEGRKLALIVAREPSVVGAISDVEARIKTYEQVEKRLGQLRADQAAVGARRDGLRREVESMDKGLALLRKKLAQVQELGPQCPLCSSKLTPEVQKEIMDGIIADGTAKRTEYDAKMAEVKAVEDAANRNDAEVKGLSDSVAQQPELRRDLEGFQREMNQIEMAKAQIGDHSHRSQRVEKACALRLAEIAVESAQWLETVNRCQAQEEKLGALKSLEDRLVALGAMVASLADGASTQQALRRGLQNFQVDLANIESAKTQLLALAQRRKQVDESHDRRLSEIKSEVVQAQGRVGIAELSLKNLAYDSSALDEAEALVASAQERETSVLDSKSKAMLELGVLESKAEACKNKTVQLESDRVRHREAMDNQFVYRELSRAFSRNGIPALILDNALGEIQAEVNAVMERLTGGRIRVEFSTQKELKTGKTAETLDIIVSDEMGARDFCQYSGGEGARIALAIRLALAKVTSRRAGKRVDLVVVDEVSDLDQAGADAFATTILEIGKDHQVLLVTHLDNIGDQFRDKIVIVKDRDGSHIQEEATV